MDYIKITAENLDKEHICCAISSSKDPQVLSKKAWLRDRLAEGLVFLKGDVRGKCFIEYIPAEHAWVPVQADGYMHINCFWVSGACKGHGYAKDLLERCIGDAKAKGKLGLTVIASPKKKPFLSDARYLLQKGFRTADQAEPYFTLLFLPFTEDAPVPQFRACAKRPRTEQSGFVLYYSGGCPYTAKYAPLLAAYARENAVPFQSILIDTPEKARNAPSAWTNFALFYNGEFVTHEIMPEKKFQALCGELLPGKGDEK